MYREFCTKNKIPFFFDFTWGNPTFLGLDRPSLASEMMLMLAAWPLNVRSGLYVYLHVVCMNVH